MAVYPIRDRYCLVASLAGLSVRSNISMSNLLCFIGLCLGYVYENKDPNIRDSLDIILNRIGLIWVDETTITSFDYLISFHCIS